VSPYNVSVATNLIYILRPWYLPWNWPSSVKKTRTSVKFRPSPSIWPRKCHGEPARPISRSDSQTHTHTHTHTDRSDCSSWITKMVLTYYWLA